MLVENGQIISIDSVTTDGVTISGDGVKKPLTATPYSGVDGIVVEDFKIGLDHEHDESKWKMYGEDERNLTPKKEGSSITLTMGGTISANDDPTEEMNGIYVGENISSNSADGVIVINAGTKKEFSYGSNNYSYYGSYSNTANKKNIEIDVGLEEPYVKEVYGKPTTLDGVSDSLVVGCGNELYQNENVFVNGFENKTPRLSRGIVVGLRNSAENGNSQIIFGINNSSYCNENAFIFGLGNAVSSTTDTNIHGENNNIFQISYGDVYGYNNNITNSTHIKVDGFNNYTYSIKNVIINGKSISSQCEQYNYYAGAYISANDMSETLAIGHNISANYSHSNIIFNQYNGSLYDYGFNDNTLKIYGSTNNIIMAETVTAALYNQVRGVISMECSANDSLLGNQFYVVNQGLNFGTSGDFRYVSYFSNIGVSNSASYLSFLNILGAKNSAYSNEYVSIIGAGNYVSGSMGVLVIGEDSAFGNYQGDWLIGARSNTLEAVDGVISLGRTNNIYHSRGVVAVGDYSSSDVSARTASKNFIQHVQDTFVMGACLSAQYGQKYLILGNDNDVKSARNTNVFGYHNRITGATKSEIIGDSNTANVCNRKGNPSLTGKDSYGVYYTNSESYDITGSGYYDSYGGIQVLGAYNRLYCSAVTYTNNKLRPAFSDISAYTDKELGLYVNGRRNYINGWGMMKVFGHNHYIYGFHDFVDVNGDNNTLNSNVHKTILYGDGNALSNVDNSLLYVKGAYSNAITNSIVFKNYNISNLSLNYISNSYLATNSFYNSNGTITRSIIMLTAGGINGWNISDSLIQCQELTSNYAVSKSTLRAANPLLLNASICNSDVVFDFQRSATIYGSVQDSFVRIWNYEPRYVYNDEYYSKNMGPFIGSNVVGYNIQKESTTSTTQDIGPTYYSDVRMCESRYSRTAMSTYLNICNGSNINDNLQFSNVIGATLSLSGGEVVASNVIGQTTTASGSMRFSNIITNNSHIGSDINYSNIIGQYFGGSGGSVDGVCHSQLMGRDIQANQVIRSNINGMYISADTINRSYLGGEYYSARIIGWSFVNVNTGYAYGISHSYLVGYKCSAYDTHKNMMILTNTSASYITNSIVNLNDYVSAQNIHKSIIASNTRKLGSITNSLIINDNYNSSGYCSAINCSQVIGYNSVDASGLTHSQVIGYATTANTLINTMLNGYGGVSAINSVGTIYNVRGGCSLTDTYFGIAIGNKINMSGTERFDIVGDFITTEINAGRYGYGLTTAGTWGEYYKTSAFTAISDKYMNITGSTFIHGTDVYATAQHFGEIIDVDGEEVTIEKPNSTFLFTNGTTAIDNLNLTAFGNKIGEIQDVSSTFLIAPEGDKVFSAVASTSAGYVEHTDVETTNSGKSIVNVEYLMGIIEGLEARIQELENSHVYTAITEDNIDTLTGEGIIYIDNN